MAGIGDLLQTADWKKEKHVPVIDVPDKVAKDEPVRVTVSVGKEIAHPNTTEHHIASIEVHFHPEGGKFPYLLGKSEFSSHGASTEGANSSTVYTEPSIVCTLKTGKSGVLHAVSNCNIHGLWTGSAELKV